MGLWWAEFIFITRNLCTYRYEPDADFRSYEDYQFLPGRAADAGYVHILCSV